ncbi:MAG: glycosyltransferase family 2 protein [Verrucomicrobiota bacterium]
MTVLPAPPPLISAVVVTYQPEIGVLDNLRRLLTQVSLVIVVDNGSDGESAKVVAAAGKLAGVQLICNESNLGIATALNLGIRRALQSGWSWVATFDQDSAIPESYFERLLQAHEMCSQAQSVGMIVPGGWTEPGAAEGKSAPTPPTSAFVQAAVNSGSLIRADVFLTTGFYDDALFIDYVDADFCLRLQKCGFKILSVTGVVLEHELGVKQTRNLLGHNLSFRIHAVWRYYYIVRNRLLCYRRHGITFPGWTLHDAGWLLLELGRIICLEDGRRQKLRAVLQGLCDGLRGRTGRHPQFPPGKAANVSEIP